MKTRILLLCLAMLSTTALRADKLDRVEPPCWWVGMETDLQLMLHGKDIAGSQVTVDATIKGLTVGKVTSTDNPLPFRGSEDRQPARTRHVYLQPGDA